MIDKFKYTDKQQKELLNSITILIDTREKENKHIIEHFDKKNIKYKSKALDKGDYSFFIPANPDLSIPRDLYFDGEITIERKASLEEISGNLTQQRDRFEKELSTFKGNMILLIENANYYDICDGNYKTEYDKKSFLGSLHTFSHRYDLPIVFMPKKEYSGIYIYVTFYYYLRELLH
jgi:ERCC4-type nuclease